MACRHLIPTLRIVSGSPGDVVKLFDLIDKLADDVEPHVVMELIDHIVPIARCICDKDGLNYLIEERFAPLLVKLLLDHNLELQRGTQECIRFLRVHGLMDLDVIKRYICSVITKLTYTCHSMESFLNAVTLMTKMVPILGQEATEECFVPRLIALSINPSVTIRLVCASQFGEYCSVVSMDVTENDLLPCFVKLCKDGCWEVRKACAEVIMSVSSTCHLETRKSTLTPLCMALLSDSHHLVRMAAFETLGPFITTFAKPRITGLAYNQHGQLVLTNWTGFEFRVNGNTNDSIAQSNVQMITSNLNESNETLNGYLENDDYDGDDNVNKSVVTDSVDDLQQYNTFLYWRDPLPVIDDLLGAVVVSGTGVILMPVKNNSSSNNNNINSISSDDNDNNGDSNDNFSVNNQNHTALEESTDHFKNTSVVSSSGDEDAGNMSFEENSESPSKSAGFGDSLENADNISTTIAVETDCQSILPDVVAKKRTVCGVKLYKKGFHVDSRNRVMTTMENYDMSVPKFKAEVWRNVICRRNICDKKVSDKPKQNIVPQELIDHFVSLTDPIDGNGYDNRFTYHIAYSLPAVALTLGKENWPLLKNVYEQLAADKLWKVRKAVASSIHELAVIIGEDAATQDLVPIFNGIIKDLDEVRIGALKHLAVFLKILRPAGRNSFLPKLADFLMIDCDMKWRFREELAEQLLQMVGLFSVADSYTHLMPLATLLMTDKVAAVRQVAILFVTELIHWVSSDIRLLHSVLVELAERFAHSTHWNQRQTFALLCSKLICQRVLPEEIFAVNVLPHLLDLSWDQVPNVRLAVARSLSTDVAHNQYFCDPQCPHHEVVMQTLRRLQTDKDRDVQYLAYSKPHYLSTSSSNTSSPEEST